MLWKKMILSAALGLALTASACAVTVTVDGKPMTAPVLEEQGTVYVPLRAMSEMLGEVTVKWEDGQAVVAGENLCLIAKPGACWMQANDRNLYIPGLVRAENGSIMVPVRALTEAMGGQVIWNGAQSRVEVTSGSGQPNAAPYTQEDLYWMSRIISAESQGEPFAGQIAVGSVVLNRVASEEFPNSIYGVIFDQKYGVQFAPVSNGTIYNPPTAQSVLAAKLVLEGAREAGESLYFIEPNLATNRWTMDNCTYVTTIGHHWFYK